MTTKTASAPALSLGQLIDMRKDIDKQIKALETSKEALAEKIKTEMKKEGLKVAYGLSGEAYQLIEFTKADYTDEAVKYAIKEKIDYLFRSDPNITRSKVFDALKRNKITEQQFLKLQKMKGPDYPAFMLKKPQEPKDV
jgi:hypothetical protein